ncbi:ABC transporter permease [Gemmatimonas aurantiaca]|uniref:ABC transporter permease n=1 Tax=Gemmatimonas aurantiaca TaxID=173480 RepID=UPI00301C641C
MDEARVRALTLGFGASAIGIANAFWASARAIAAADIGFPVNGLFVREARCSVGETIAPAGALCLEAASVPMTGGTHEWRRVEGMNGRGVPNVIVLRVVPGYFEMLGVPIVSGRDFEAGEGEGAAAHTVIVSRNLAIALGGVRSIVNERIRVADTMVRVVGVAGDVRHFGAAAGNPFIVYALDAPRSTERHLHVWRETGVAAAPDRYAHFIREYHAAYFAPAWVLATFGLVACLLFFFVPDHDERLLLTIGGGIGVSVVVTWAMRSLVGPLLYGTQVSVVPVVWIGTAGGVVAWLVHRLRQRNRR